MGSVAALPLVSRAEVTFWAAPKVTQPVKSVDHKNRHSFKSNTIIKNNNPFICFAIKFFTNFK